MEKMNKRFLCAIMAVIFVFLQACKDGVDDVVASIGEQGLVVQIVPNPKEAIVTINDVKTYKMQGENGTQVNWTVEREDYLPQQGTLVIDGKSITLEVNLVKEQFLLEIIPTPADATVTINGEETNALLLDKRTAAVWSVQKTGYTTQSGTLDIMQDENLSIVLDLEPGYDPDMTAGSTGIYRYQEEDGSLVAYTTVRAADGRIWLQQNLGSTQVATVANDANAYGDLYQWGRWRDGHESRTGNNIQQGPATPNNPAGLFTTGPNPFYYHSSASNYWWNGAATDTWVEADLAHVSSTKGACPCKLVLKNGWRLPTKDEWEAVVAAENITNLNTAFASNLKIPTAGSRGANNGNIGSVGSQARLWTSTAAAGLNANLVNISSGSAIFSAFARGGGLAIRCIKEE